MGKSQIRLIFIQGMRKNVIFVYVSTKALTLGYSNEEVKIGFIETLIPSYLNQPTRESNFYVVSFVRDLMKGDIE